MGLPKTYNAIVSQVQSLFEDDTIELQNYIPVAIGLTELDLTRIVDTKGVTQSASVTCSPGASTIAAPSGLRLLRNIRYNNGTQRVLLDKKEDTFIYDYWPVETNTGEPIYYALEDTNTILLAPTPDSSYTMNISYEGQPVALSSGNQTNYFTDFCADALYMGTLTHCALFLRNAQMAETFGSLYQRATDSIQNEGRRQRQDDSTSPYNPNPRTNNVKQGSN